MEHVDKILVLGTTSFVTYFLGGWSMLLTALLVLNILDFATGLTANWKNRLSSKAFRGGVKKGIMWMWIGISNIVYSILLYLGYDMGEVLPNCVAIYYIIMEIISLEENSKKLGMGMPSPLGFAIDKLRDIFNAKTGQNPKEDENGR